MDLFVLVAKPRFLSVVVCSLMKRD